MKRIIAYTLIGLVSFLTFVIVFAPAATLWNLVKDEVTGRVRDLQVLTVDGTIWNGNAMLRYREFPPAMLNWRLSPAALVNQTAVVDASLEGEGLQLTTGTTATRANLSAIGSGSIHNSYINPVSRRYGLTFPGELLITGLDIRSDLKWVTAIEGKLYWGGGRILLQNFAEPLVINLPALEGDISRAGDNLLLDVTQAGKTVILVTLRPTGWAVVDIRARLFDLAGLPRLDSLAPDNSAALLEEKIF